MSVERRAALWATWGTYTPEQRKAAWEAFERWERVPIEHRRPIKGPKPPCCISCGSIPSSRYHDYSPRFDCGPHPVVRVFDGAVVVLATGEIL